jgi:hypothetical protein
MISETSIEKKVVAHCKTRGLLTYKFSSPAHRGVPDRIIMGGSKVMFLEIKRPGQKPTPLQERELSRIRQEGIQAEWADSFELACQLIDDAFVENFLR